MDQAYQFLSKKLIKFHFDSKVIGARFYNSRGEYDSSDFKSPRDSEGHRSHTASTAGGNVVKGASYYGLATDRVNVISVSLGSEEPREYFKDPIAIGSFHAMRKEILTSNSAGNAGPFSRPVSNFSPWSLTKIGARHHRQGNLCPKLCLAMDKSLLAFAIGGYTSIQRVTQWNLDFVEHAQGDRWRWQQQAVANGRRWSEIVFVIWKVIQGGTVAWRDDGGAVATRSGLDRWREWRINGVGGSWCWWEEVEKKVERR
ncbi:hypothetical protein IFM89_017084 [Coptis chinensis]|uniref:Phospho-2-dehydro-3-deoxyheptonate aldolase n=1 Tax=Coptis chinensis TaxID=261450 RepID=A0A835HDW0_9MAGN|nr:hypothetical protein IFM89_017084 [Coptis chinensis]